MKVPVLMPALLLITPTHRVDASWSDRLFPKPSVVRLHSLDEARTQIFNLPRCVDVREHVRKGPYRIDQSALFDLFLSHASTTDMVSRNTPCDGEGKDVFSVCKQLTKREKSFGETRLDNHVYHKQPNSCGGTHLDHYAQYSLRPSFEPLFCMQMCTCIRLALYVSLQCLPRNHFLHEVRCPRNGSTPETCLPESVMFPSSLIAIVVVHFCMCHVHRLQFDVCSAVSCLSAVCVAVS